MSNDIYDSAAYKAGFVDGMRSFFERAQRHGSNGTQLISPIAMQALANEFYLLSIMQKPPERYCAQRIDQLEQGEGYDLERDIGRQNKQAAQDCQELFAIEGICHIGAAIRRAKSADMVGNGGCEYRPDSSRHTLPSVTFSDLRGE